MENLRKLRTRKKVTQQDMANFLGVARSTYTQYETGASQPDNDTIVRLANYFGVSTDHLLGNTSAIDNKKGVRINVYGRVPAGIPIEAVEDIIDWEEIPEDWTKDGQEYMALKVEGDSMSPKYLDGDIVIIKIQPDCESGQDAVVFVNGYDATLKRVLKNENSVILQPLNPEYETKVYRSSDDPITILGIVVELRRRI
jgi:repressor LexA